MGRASALIAAAIAAGCGSSNPVLDASATGDGADEPIDAALDADLVDHDVSGTYLDWDSTTAAPCPIVGAKLTVYYGGGRTATTDMNGDFTISLAPYLPRFDIEEPTTASSCADGVYQLPGMVFASGLIQWDGVHVVMRSLTTARLETFYAAIGAPFAPTRGQLFVHIAGPPRAVSISSPHDALQAFDGATWSPSDTGSDVFVPNIDLSTSAWTTVTIAGDAVGAGSIELVPGTITYITVITN